MSNLLFLLSLLLPVQLLAAAAATAAAGIAAAAVDATTAAVTFLLVLAATWRFTMRRCGTCLKRRNSNTRCVCGNTQKTGLTSKVGTPGM